MSELANITSVQVTWNQPEGGLAVDEYVVSYHRLNGRNGQCSSFQDEGNVRVRARGEGETNTANLHLQAYSVYSCTVNAAASRGGGTLTNETSFNITTNSTGARAICTRAITPYLHTRHCVIDMCYISKPYIK